MDLVSLRQEATRVRVSRGGMERESVRVRRDGMEREEQEETFATTFI